MKTKVLLPILVVPFLAGCHIHFANTYNYNNSDKYTKFASEATITDKIENLEINYVSGTVDIVKGEAFKINEAQGEYPCYYWNNVGEKKFTVQYVENNLDLDNKDFSKKNLTITVPYDLKSIKLNLVSCGFTVSAFSVDNLEINVVSGSGSVTLESNKRTSFDAVSGAINLNIANTLNEESININTVSGSSTLSLDQRRGFNVSFKKISGVLTNNFGEPTDPSLSKYSINIETTSGNALITKNN